MTCVSPSPGKVQHRWSRLLCWSVREGRGETSVPLIFSQDRVEAESKFPPPHRSPEQAVCFSRASCRSWTGQEWPLEGLKTSTALLELPGLPPEMRNPGTITNCQIVSNCKEYKLFTWDRGAGLSATLSLLRVILRVIVSLIQMHYQTFHIQNNQPPYQGFLS